MYCDGMDRAVANALLAAGDRELARNAAKHPLLGMAGFVHDLIAGPCLTEDPIGRYCFQSPDLSLMF